MNIFVTSSCIIKKEECIYKVCITALLQIYHFDTPIEQLENSMALHKAEIYSIRA